MDGMANNVPQSQQHYHKICLCLSAKQRLIPICIPVEKARVRGTRNRNVRLIISKATYYGLLGLLFGSLNESSSQNESLIFFV